MGLTRFGVSVDSALLKKFDKRIQEKGYSNRSEAFRDLIRQSFVEDEIEKGSGEMVGTVTIVYNHHEMELPKNLVKEQHDHHSMVLSSVHVHLDRHNCMEVVMLKGRGDKIRSFAEKLIARKGVKHGKLAIMQKDIL